MKLEKITETKLKIMFNSEELEENNISLHSFLSNSIEAQRLFLAILDIANEDLNFNTTGCKVSYEAFSFENKTFVIFITKDQSLPASIVHGISSSLFDGNFFQVLRDDTISQNSSFNFIDNKLKKSKNVLTYFFYNLEDVFDFCKLLCNFNISENIESSLYQYENLFILEIYKTDSITSDLEKIELICSEIKNTSDISEVSKTRLKEFSKILIEKNAISKLSS